MSFVTLYHGRENAKLSCATQPLLLPRSDVVCGEYTEPTDTDETASYPAGTVLMYADSVAADRDLDSRYCGLPWFIVFKLCPTSLLRGTVPVGRVVSCVADDEPSDDEPSDDDNMDRPFDAAMLQCFETRCGTKECSVGARVAPRGGAVR